MFKEMEFGTYYEAIVWELRAALSRYGDKWLEILCREEAERPLYLSAIEQKRITVVLLACALLEHAINFYLGTKCGTEDFKELELKSVLKKWIEFPKTFVPAYDLPAASDLDRDLRAIVYRRNAIMHAKSRLSIDGDKRHTGNEPAPALDENEFIERCASTPFRLVENLLHFDHEAVLTMSSVRTWCGSVMQELGGARYRFDYVARIPEELVSEIMEQGHRRDRAKLFAALIGEVPRRRRDGSIAVRRHGEVIEVLNPLKFFASTDFALDLTDPTVSLQATDQGQKGSNEHPCDGEQASDR